jgi:hypothetical protein
MQEGRVWSREACDSAEALPSKEARSRAVGHVAVRLAPCLRIKPVCEITRSVGY